MQKYIPQLITLTKYLVLLAALYLVLVRVDVYLEQKAINECSTISRFEKTDGGTKIAYPLQDLYKECLKQKGL